MATNRRPLQSLRLARKFDCLVIGHRFIRILHKSRVEVLLLHLLILKLLLLQLQDQNVLLLHLLHLLGNQLLHLYHVVLKACNSVFKLTHLRVLPDKQIHRPRRCPDLICPNNSLLKIDKLITSLNLDLSIYWYIKVVRLAEST